MLRAAGRAILRAADVPRAAECRPVRCFRAQPRAGSGTGAWDGSSEEEEEGRRSFRFYKSRGQHILTNPRALDTIVRSAGVLPGDTVLEIGPGTGNLTLRLLSAARRVVAVEIDHRMVAALRRRVSAQGLTDKLHVICGDALKTEFPEFDLCVANIPYGISSPLVAKLLYAGGGPRRGFRSATLLLQKEFARRLVARPGDSERNRLAMNVGLVSTVELLMDVSRRDFVPPPRVDSSVVKIRPKPAVPEVDLDEWRALTRVCFCQKRKTLGAIFKQKRMLQLLLKSSCNFAAARSEEEEEEEEDEEEADEEEQGGGGGESDEGDGGEPAEMAAKLKQKLLRVLEDGGFLEARPTKLSDEDMLRLLSLFNREGIRFHQSD